MNYLMRMSQNCLSIPNKSIPFIATILIRVGLVYFFFGTLFIYTPLIAQTLIRGQDSVRRRVTQDSLRLLTEQDHKMMLGLLNISSLRPGANGNDPKAANAANYDESKANPFP